MYFYIEGGEVPINSYFRQSTDAYSYIADILTSSALIYELVVFGTFACYPRLPVRA